MSGWVERAQKAFNNWTDHATETRPMVSGSRPAPTPTAAPTARGIDLVDQAHHWIAARCGWLVPTFEDTTARLGQVQGAITFARIHNNMGRSDPEVARMLDKADEVLALTIAKMTRLTGLVLDADAAISIMSASAKLKAWANNGSMDPGAAAEAARQFDILFGALGRYCSKLGPVLGGYAAIFNEIAEKSFFSRMQRFLMEDYNLGGMTPAREREIFGDER